MPYTHKLSLQVAFTHSFPSKKITFFDLTDWYLETKTRKRNNNLENWGQKRKMNQKLSWFLDVFFLNYHCNAQKTEIWIVHCVKLDNHFKKFRVRIKRFWSYIRTSFSFKKNPYIFDTVEWCLEAKIIMRQMSSHLLQMCILAFEREKWFKLIETAKYFTSFTKIKILQRWKVAEISIQLHTNFILKKPTKLFNTPYMFWKENT